MLEAVYSTRQRDGTFTTYIFRSVGTYLQLSDELCHLLAQKMWGYPGGGGQKMCHLICANMSADPFASSVSGSE